MLVRTLMSAPAVAVRPEENLADAGVVMLREDCGALPVIDDEGVIVGVVTDRDICIAAATRDRPLSQMLVSSLASKPVSTVYDSDTVSRALDVMRRAQVRRLPVVDQENRLVGMLSINDLVLAASEKRGSATAPTAGDVMKTMKAISRHWRPRLVGAAANGRALSGVPDPVPGDFDVEE